MGDCFGMKDLFIYFGPLRYDGTISLFLTSESVRVLKTCAILTVNLCCVFRMEIKNKY